MNFKSLLQQESKKMNILYCLIALFFTVPTASFSMNSKYYENMLPLDKTECPGSPLNSESVIMSLFTYDQFKERRKSDEFKKPMSASPLGGDANGTAGESKKNIHFYSHQPLAQVNPSHYAVCNYPNCKIIVHKSYAKAHITTHFNNDVNYKKNDPTLFYTVLNASKLDRPEMGNTKEVNVQEQQDANNTNIKYKLLN